MPPMGKFSPAQSKAVSSWVVVIGCPLPSTAGCAEQLTWSWQAMAVPQNQIPQILRKWTSFLDFIWVPGGLSDQGKKFKEATFFPFQTEFQKRKSDRLGLFLNKWGDAFVHEHMDMNSDHIHMFDYTAF